MFFFVLLLFIFFPIAEIMVLGRVAARIGIWDTLILLVFSAMFGGYLARVQGNIALQRIQRALAEGRAPTIEMIDSFLIFLGGILFIIPGFISDILGLFLIFPVTRWIIRWWVLSGIQSSFRARNARPPRPEAARQTSGITRRDDVSDAEIVE